MGYAESAEAAGHAVTVAERQAAYLQHIRLRWFLAGAAAVLLVFSMFYFGFIAPLQRDIEKEIAQIAQQRDTAMAENTALRAALEKARHAHSSLVLELPNPLPTEQ